MTFREKNYPWLVMLACCVFMGAVMGVGTNCNGIFMLPIAEALGVGMGDVSLFATIMGIMGAVMVPVVGRMISRVDIRKIMTLAVVLTALPFIGMTKVTTLWQYCVMGAVIGVGVAFGSFMTVTVVLNNWFVKNNGIVVGIVMSTSSLVGVAMNFVLNKVIETSGWQFASQIKGVIMLCALPFIWGIIRMYPSQKGVRAWGEGEVPEEAEEETHESAQKGKKLHLPASFVMIIGFALVTSFTMNHSSHFQTIAVSSGLSMAVGASMLSASLLGEFTGKLTIGALSDKVGAIRAVVLAALVGLGSIIGLFFLGTIGAGWFAAICAFAYGLMLAISSVGYSLIIRNMFGNRNYPKYYPYLSITSTIGWSVGSPAIGYIYDMSGSYKPSFVIGLVGVSVALVLLLTGQSLAKKEKLKRKNAN